MQIWHTSDVTLFPAQKVRQTADERRTLLAIWTPASGRTVVAGSDIMETAFVLGDWRHAVERVTAPHAWGTMFGRPYHDLWVVSLADGTRSRLLERVRYSWTSPGGRPGAHGGAVLGGPGRASPQLARPQRPQHDDAAADCARRQGRRRRVLSGHAVLHFARRAGKPMVLLVYEGENHSFTQKPNQIDYHRRILEWFGHYLKDEPAPAWMTDGVPLRLLERRSGASVNAERARAWDAFRRITFLQGVRLRTRRVRARLAAGTSKEVSCVPREAVRLG